MDPLVGIAGRIAEIQGRISALAPPVVHVPRTTAPPATTSSMTFGAALDQAIAAEGTGRTTSSGSTTRDLAVGTGKALLDAKGIPRELRQYDNGRIPAHALEKIGGTGHSLWGPAAHSAEAMIAAAKRDGVTIGITDSYRTYETQVRLVKEKGLYSKGGLAAAPGTSNHGWGMALDLRLDGEAQAWMRKNGGQYGFVEDVPREPWHWNYRPKS